MPTQLTRHGFDSLQIHRDEFDVGKPSFTQQYAGLYFCRLAALRPGCLERATARWAARGARHVGKVLDVAGTDLCFLVGTIFCDYAGKPNILAEVAAEALDETPAEPLKYVGEADSADAVILEDESGRVQLVGDLVAATLLVTGVVVAVLGRETADGQFGVLDLIYPPPLRPQPPLAPAASGRRRWLALVSGLAIGGPSTELLPLQLLFEFLGGGVGGAAAAAQSAEIAQLVIAGNALALPQARTTARDSGRLARRSESAGEDAVAGPLRLLDRLLASAAASLDVAVLPGAHDPAVQSLPQQPLPDGLFPLSSRFSSFRTVHNPFVAEEDGLLVAGHAGQPLDDIAKYSRHDDRLDMAEAVARRWQNMAPTCPDTLWCYPFKDRDPFVLPATPHVFFCGNQPEFATRLVDADGARTRLVLLPPFHSHRLLVLVDALTLDVSVVQFPSGA